MTPKPFTSKEAAPYRPLDWTGVYPPDFPKGSVPGHVAIVMDGEKFLGLITRIDLLNYLRRRVQ